MASGRSGQLVVSGAKDALTSSPSSSHSSSHSSSSPHTDAAAFFLKHRFRDTALVIFQQHAQRLREVSPGYYTPLPSTSPTPSVHVLPGIGPAQSRSDTGWPHPDPSPSPPSPSSPSSPSPSPSPSSLDKASLVSGNSAHQRSGVSPLSSSATTTTASSSVKGTSFQNGSESSLEKTPPLSERSRRVPEENGAWPDRAAGAGGGSSPRSAARLAASFSESSSSLSSSEPDSDFEERFPAAREVPSVSVREESEARHFEEEDEEKEKEEKSVDRGRGERSPARGELRTEEGVLPLKDQGESVGLEARGVGGIPRSPIESRSPVAGDLSPCGGGGGPPLSSPEDLSREGEPPSSCSDYRLSYREPRSSPEAVLQRPSCGEVAGGGGGGGGDLSASSEEEEVQITRL